MEEPRTAPLPYLGLVLEKLRWVVAALPEDMRKSSNPNGFPWELLMCAAIVGFFAVFLFSWRSFRSIRSRLYVEERKSLL
uniref:Putative cutaneous t-cell lymphoma-associated antigen 5 n=1 Tax=Ixodes ricinus TaxID=34613 RepID=A0A0K8RFL2_IXORI